MNLLEAIEIKKRYQYLLPKESYPELIVADNLSIEALTFLERWRSKAEIQPYPLLPSETTD